jgi:hypothetical protein
MTRGVLRAERQGPHVKFTFEFPPRPDDLHSDEEWFDHAFSVERFEGTETDDDGNEVEIWRPIHTGTRKYVRHHTDMHMHHPESPNPPHAGPHNHYRALVYRIAERCPSGVIIQETSGIHSETVTV